MMDIFAIEDTRHNDEFIDYDLYDRARNAAQRSWVVTHNTSTGEWSGWLRRSETEESIFGDGIELPKKMVAAIRKAIGRETYDEIRNY